MEKVELISEIDLNLVKQKHRDEDAIIYQHYVIVSDGTVYKYHKRTSGIVRCGDRFKLDTSINGRKVAKVFNSIEEALLYRDKIEKEEGVRVNRIGDLVEIKCSIHKGYKCIKIWENGCKKIRLLHRIILEFFVGQSPDDKTMALHIDDNKLNNHVNNLYWGDDYDNTCDKIRNGIILKGERNPNSKITYTDVLNIRKIYKLGVFQSEIAGMYDIGQSQVSRIIRGESWTEER